MKVRTFLVLAAVVAAPQPKTLWVIRGAAHQNFHLFARSEYEQRVLAFLGDALRPYYK